MRKSFQQILLVLFAFLQCLTPVAHAHVGGNNTDHSLYSHAWLASAQMQTSHAENVDGAVITMPHAFPVENSPVVFQAAVLSNDLKGCPIGDGEKLHIFSTRSLRFATTAPYALAWSQAPPPAILVA